MVIKCQHYVFSSFAVRYSQVYSCLLTLFLLWTLFASIHKFYTTIVLHFSTLSALLEYLIIARSAHTDTVTTTKIFSKSRQLVTSVAHMIFRYINGTCLKVIVLLLSERKALPVRRPAPNHQHKQTAQIPSGGPVQGGGGSGWLDG